MTEILFYHLERRTLEETLPSLVARTLEHGWKALVVCESTARAESLDRLLWTYDDQSFVAHGLASEPDADRQPVLISVVNDNINNANVLFLIGGSTPLAWDSAETQAFGRIVVMFDGRDPAAVEAAREAWKAAKTAGQEMTYWQENPNGKWERRG